MFTKCALFGFKCRSRDKTTIFKKNCYYNLNLKHLKSKTVILKSLSYMLQMTGHVAKTLSHVNLFAKQLHIIYTYIHIQPITLI